MRLLGSSAKLQKQEKAESRKVWVTIDLQKFVGLDIFKKKGYSSALQTLLRDTFLAIVYRTYSDTCAFVKPRTPVA